MEQALAGDVADKPMPIAITAGVTARAAAPKRAEAGVKRFFIGTLCVWCVCREVRSPPDDIYIAALYLQRQPISLDLGHLVYMVYGIRL